MEYTDKLKEYIGWLIEKYYSKYDFLHDKNIDYWKNIYLDKYLKSNLSPTDITKEISQDIESKRQAYEYRKMYIENKKEETVEPSINEEPQIIQTVEVIEDKKEEIDETKPIGLSFDGEEVNTMLENEPLEDKISITDEKPMEYSKKNNKGFAVFLSIVITFLVGIAMILVTMISYTLIK